MNQIDGYRESMSGLVIDERGRVMPMEDYEARKECRQAMRVERWQRIGRAGLWVAVGMIVTVIVVSMGR